jgi:multidrug transporter EmrE-like cation transporter
LEIFKGIIYGFIAQILTFLQLQGTLKFGWYQKHAWIILISSIPLTWLYYHSIQSLVKGFAGEMWPSRLIGFGVGIIVFTFMSYYMFKEPITTKTLVCLGLGTLIILIQIFWK